MFILLSRRQASVALRSGLSRPRPSAGTNIGAASSALVSRFRAMPARGQRSKPPPRFFTIGGTRSRGPPVGTLSSRLQRAPRLVLRGSCLRHPLPRLHHRSPRRVPPRAASRVAGFAVDRFAGAADTANRLLSCGSSSPSFSRSSRSRGPSQRVPSPRPATFPSSISSSSNTPAFAPSSAPGTS